MNQPTQETLSYLLIQVAKAHRNFATALFADLGLYPGQELLLMQLWQENGLAQSELCDRLKVEPPTLTKMLQRLAGSGIVERRKDSEDARVCRVYLSQAGYALQAPVQESWKHLEARTLANLTLEEQVLLRRLLRQIVSNLT